MDRLWAPWRMQYLVTVDKHEEGCIFCTKPQADEDEKNLILLRRKHCFVIMNLYPYNNGHLLIVPYRHTGGIHDLDADTRLELFDTVDYCVEKLRKALNPEGFNVGLNIGRVAGSGIDQHVHLHIVPRWNGDTNFMPVLANTKVISESLQECYKRLSKVLREGP